MVKKRNDKLDGKEIVQSTKNVIIQLRDQNVILDSEIAKIYNIETKRINEKVKRNIGKFPKDFMFQLTKQEFDDLKSQNATSSFNWGGRRTRPYAFTEHGVLQIANLINSGFANNISVFVIRAFVQMRETIVVQQEILNKKYEIENSKATAPQKIKPLETKNIDRFLKGIGPKIQTAMDKLLDTIINPETGATTRDEVKDLLKESINNLKERLKQKGLENEEISARINKLFAEADKERATARKTYAESEQIEFITTVRKLRLVLEAQKLMLPENDEETKKRIDTFITMLKEIGDKED